MNKILLIAKREFLTTVANKGFVFGLFLMPVLIGLAVLLGPRLLDAMRSPQVVGRVAVIDSTGKVLPVLRSTLSLPAIEERRQAEARRAPADVPGGERMASSAAERGFAPAPDLT